MQTRLVTLLAIVLVGAAGVVPTAVADDPPQAASAEYVSQADLLERLERKDPDLVILDVRTPAEFAAGHVPGARNISHDLLASRLAELAPLRDKQVVLYCRSGRRTLLAADVLHAAGFKRLAHLEGDYLAWETEHRPIER
jgi:rhodanese-related sulfurtransferase